LEFDVAIGFAPDAWPVAAAAQCGEHLVTFDFRNLLGRGQFTLLAARPKGSRRLARRTILIDASWADGFRKVG
jgi:hypothetical protein